MTQNQTGAGTTRLFHDNDNRVIAEVNATGTTIREYVWLEDLPIAVLDGSTNTANPSLFFVHADHLNRPIAMSNASRDWVWRAQYEPFGAVHQIVGPAANDNRFPGQMFQLEAGLAYNWHRHCDATLGRYTQVDPLGLQTLLSDGPNVYGYVGQKPLEMIDPTGLMGRETDKQRSKEIPSMYKGCKPLAGENGRTFAERLLREIGGLAPGTYPTGPGSDFSKLKKFGDRNR